MAEACFQGDVAHGPLTLQEELSCALDTAFHDVAMDWKSNGLAEKGLEMGDAKSGNVGQLLEREVTIEVGLDVVAYGAKAPFR